MMKTQYYTAASIDGFISHVGALAMGSTTYEWVRRNITTPPLNLVSVTPSGALLARMHYAVGRA